LGGRSAGEVAQLTELGEPVEAAGQEAGVDSAGHPGGVEDAGDDGKAEDVLHVALGE